MAKITNYTRRKIAECTGVWLKDCVDWLVKTQGGCCHLKFDVDAKDDYCICVGFVRVPWQRELSRIKESELLEHLRALGLWQSAAELWMERNPCQRRFNDYPARE